MTRLFTVVLLFLCSLPPTTRAAQAAARPDDANVPPGLLAEPSEKTANPEAALARHVEKLRKTFDTLLEDPAGYRKLALKDCSVFPEGRIYPFGIPALAYSNLGLSDESQRESCAAQMRKLIDLLISVVVEGIHPPRGDLRQLTHYQDEGTRLATLNLALACYALISDDGRYDQLHEQVSRLLRQALNQEPGQPLASYPEYTWYFDTMMALVSLNLFDRAHAKTDASVLLEQHLAWIQNHATDPDTGLPIAYQGGLPRGCDISMQICLLQQVDPRIARRLYTAYVKHHWSDLSLVAGFREWPKSKSESFLGDIDSGPLLLGIGPTATGVGLGATRAVRDTDRLSTLVRQLQLMPDLMSLLEQGGHRLFGGDLRITKQYVSGFLYGDAVLFYAMTWVPYPSPAQAKAGRKVGAN